MAAAALVHVWFFAVFDLPVLDHEFLHTGHGAVWSYHQLQNGQLLDYLQGAFTYTGVRQPQLISRLMGMACHLFGPDRFVMRMVNLPFLVLLIVSTYLLGKAVWSSRVGLLAAFTATAMPQLISHSRRGELCFFEAALLVSALLLLVRSGWLARRRSAVGFGLLLGLTLHTHEAALFYVALVLAPVAAGVLLRGTREQRINLCIVVALTAIFFAVFYPSALFNPQGPRAMKLYPGAEPYPSFIQGLQDCLVSYGHQLGQGVGWFNLAMLPGACVLLLIQARRASWRLSALKPALLLLALIGIPFLSMVVGTITFREFDTTEHIVPSHALLALLCAYAASAVPYRLGDAALLVVNAPTWILCVVKLLTLSTGLEVEQGWLKDRLKKHKRQYAEMAMLHRVSPGAGQVRDYFRGLFAGECAEVYGYNLPIPAPSRSYFDDLLMHGVIQPLHPGHNSQPSRTMSVKICKDRIYLVLIYKDTRRLERVDLKDGGQIYLTHNIPGRVREIIRAYDCSLIKEFHAEGVPGRPLIISVVRATARGDALPPGGRHEDGQHER